MTVFIDNQSGAPIYEQIFSQIRRQIMAGTLGRDEPLPSIRSLAKDLRISVITTKRAYDELEGAGLIYTLPGKGSFVAAADRTLLRREQEKEIRERLRQVRVLAVQCGLEDGELWQMYDEIKEERQ